MFLMGVHTFNVNTFCIFSYRKWENEKYLQNSDQVEHQDHFMISCFICAKQLSAEKFKGFDPNLLKNLKGAFPSRAPDSLWELSLIECCLYIGYREFYLEYKSVEGAGCIGVTGKERLPRVFTTGNTIHYDVLNL